MRKHTANGWNCRALCCGCAYTTHSLENLRATLDSRLQPWGLKSMQTFTAKQTPLHEPNAGHAPSRERISSHHESDRLLSPPPRVARSWKVADPATTEHLFAVRHNFAQMGIFAPQPARIQRTCRSTKRAMNTNNRQTASPNTSPALLTGRFSVPAPAEEAALNVAEMKSLTRLR